VTFVLSAIDQIQDVYMINPFDGVPDTVITLLLLGEIESLPEGPIHSREINRREFARKNDSIKPVGSILTFDLDEIPDKKVLREKLGYGDEKLIICTIGGTGVGKALLDLCAKSYPLIKEKIPDLKMVLVGGPYIKVDESQVPEGVEVRGYVPKLYEHMATADFVVTQGGGTTVSEIIALNKPFLYFPLEEHWEQAAIAVNLNKAGIGTRFVYPDTTAEILAEKILENIEKEVSYPSVFDGAQRIANAVLDVLKRHQSQ